MPEPIRLQPQLLRIESRRADGTPDLLRWVLPDDVVELSKDEHQNCFLQVFTPPLSFEKFAGQIVTEGLEEG